jgi:hypothetical protein
MKLKERATTELGGEAVEEISGALRPLLADVFALYPKTTNFHWHIRGPHFRNYHLLLDEHAEQIVATRSVGQPSDRLAKSRAASVSGTTTKRPRRPTICWRSYASTTRAHALLTFQARGMREAKRCRHQQPD